jgi:hypothetical protein
MKQFASAKVGELAARYGEQAPLASACCNACRTCVTTNAVTIAIAALAASASGVARFAKRLTEHGREQS